MLRKIKYGFLIVFLALVVFGVIKDKVFDTPQKCRQRVLAFANQSAKNDIETNVFKTNKVLTYKIYYWSLVPMGELKFKTQITDLGNVFSFEAATKGSIVEAFITAKAAVVSYFSKNIHLPYEYAEETVVKGKRKTKEILFDQANLITTRGDKKFKIPTDTFDPVSAFVHMLTLPLEKGKEQRTKFVSGEDVYVLKSVVLKETDKIAEIFVDMRRENLTSSHGGGLHVWVTADNARIPLVFKSWSPVGYASVVLVKAEE